MLGMHRSGTSALARVLQLCGADIGSRVLGESAGNEAGHWEDAFAVELHERLLDAHGTRWDEALGLPARWMDSDAAAAARGDIASYLAEDRARHGLWAVKDPRLSLFADLWIEAAQQVGQPVGAVLMLRHPMEVAKSLATRDGIAPGRGLVLWLDYTLAAVSALERVPGTIITYGQLLEDWRSCIQRLGGLPGGGRLRTGRQVAAEVDAFLDGGLRHHAEDGDAQLPLVVREVWNELSGVAAEGVLPPGAVKKLLRRIRPVRQLVHPLLGEMRVTQRKLWERIARAEAPLAEAAASTLPTLAAIKAELAPLSTVIPAGLRSVAEQVELNRAALVEAISTDLQRMQDVTTAAVKSASLHEREAQLANEIAPRLQALEGGLLPLAERLPGELGMLADAVNLHRSAMLDAISGDLRRMQYIAAEAGQTAVAFERDALMARELGPRLQALQDELLPLAQRVPVDIDALVETVHDHRNVLIEAISGDLRRMQEAAAAAVQSAATHERGAQLAAEIAPRLHALESELLPLAQRLPGELGNLAEAVGLHRNALIEAISGDLRRMQDAVSAAVASAAKHEREAALVRELAPRLKEIEAGLGTMLAGVPAQQQLETWIARCAVADAEIARFEVQASEAAEALAERDARIVALEARAVAGEARADDLKAELEAARAHVFQLEHEAVRLRADSAMLAQVIDSRSWRLTRPLRVVTRVLTGRGGHEAAMVRQAFRKLVAHAPFVSRRSKMELIEQTLLAAPGADPAHLPDSGMAELVTLASPADGFADVFVWSVIDWHFRTQRPQHLARALAERGHRVFYISNNFMDDAEPGFRVEPLDASGRLFQVNLHLSGSPPIYHGLPDDAQVLALQRSLGTLLGWTCTRDSLSIVHHPYWSRLARAVPNARMVYDCMDHHAGFENNAPGILEAERRLLADADMVTLTSAWLERELGPLARATALIRNAGEYDFFSQVPPKAFRDANGRRVIGYFGAIAEWFDLGLVREVARAFPDALLVLVGNDTVDARGQLADLDNVMMVGEVPYADLPYWLHGFDVALLPFRVIELTLATNPVKIYEYLAAGKPVVAVDLPEMTQFDGLVRVAKNAEAFVGAVGELLDAPEDADVIAARQAFAAGQTWSHRARALDDAIEHIGEPLVSVVVLTYNNLAFTQNCLFSLESYSDYSNLEVIVVDNASSDGSREWLGQWATEASAAGHRRRLILNDDNLGFSAGNNVGLAAAEGEFLVVLNNDTYVTHGWVRTLCSHLRRDPKVGLVGPVTNNIGNEARIDIGYDDIVDMHRAAGEYTRAHAGQSMPLETAAFFCVAMPRHVYEAVGGLDEAFGLGFFEDDDYCRRVAGEGWGIACAEDVFVHHHLSASFDALKAEAKQALFEKNKAIYEAKWGAWQPHVYR